MDDQEVMTLEELDALGNQGAPEEWLKHLDGEGIGDGFEGIHGAVMDEYFAETDQDHTDADPGLRIQASPEIKFKACRSSNYTSGRQGCRVQYIVVHYTAGARTTEGAAEANCIYFARESTGASAHYFVDDGYTIWQSVPEGDTAWACGNWAFNTRSISIEVCTAGAFTNKEITRLAWIVQHLMSKYGIPASRVIRHYDCNGKHCPSYYVDRARWTVLHARITSGSAGQEPAPAPSKPAQQPSKPAQTNQLTVDGSWGRNTTKRGQQLAGTTADGVISNQPAVNARYVPSAVSGVWQWRQSGYGQGSSFIKAVQKRLGITADGFCGPNTTLSMQYRLKELGFYSGALDKYFGPESCKALQRMFNAGKFF